MTANDVSSDDRLSPEEKQRRANWMSKLDGDMRLNDIWIPGTHDSATGHGVRYTNFNVENPIYGTLVGLAGKDLTISQSRPIDEQLKYGVRFIDLRLSGTLVNDEINIVHNIVPLDVGMADVASILTNFLSAHPGEVVILALKNDGRDNNDAVIDRAIQKYFNSEIFHKLDYIPYLSEIRGKVLVMSRTACDPERERSLGYPINVPDNTTGALTCPDGLGRPTAFIQDQYQPAGKGGFDTTTETLSSLGSAIISKSGDTTDVEKTLNSYLATKKTTIKDAFSNKDSANPNIFRIGFASATQSPITPLIFADRINPWIAGVLSLAEDRAWIVPIDFAGNQNPDEDPVIAIINANFNQMPKRSFRDKMFPGDRFGRDVYLHSPSERYRAGLNNHGVFWIFDVGAKPGEDHIKIGPETDGQMQEPADFIQLKDGKLKAFTFSEEEVAATEDVESKVQNNIFLELTNEGNLVLRHANECQILWESRTGKFIRDRNN